MKYTQLLFNQDGVVKNYFDLLFGNVILWILGDYG